MIKIPRIAHFFIVFIAVMGVSSLVANNLDTNTGIEVLAPTVDFTFNNNNSCSDTPITFVPIISGDSPYTYNWDFGDGTSSTNSNPTHTFTALGCGIQNFSVKLTVTDRNGLSNSVIKTVSVQQKPDLKFVNLNAGSSSVFERCGDNNSSLSYSINVGNSSASTTCITSYNIDWGDGSTETNVSFPKQHTYARLGSFNMIITAVGGSGCNNSISYIVKNSNNPVGALIAPGNTTNFCVPLAPMNFAIGSWALNPTDTRYQVNYGDGSSASYTQTQLESSTYYNAANPAASQNFPIPHTFTRFNCPSGNTVILTITNSCGRTDLSAGPIIILDKPIVSFSSTSIACVNSAVSFSNTTVAGYTNNCSTVGVYTWDFGDGTAVSNSVNPSHVYTSPGSYTVKLNAVTPCGVGVEYRRTICVEPILQPDFTYVKACINSNTQITNTTDTRLACGAQSYYWDITYYTDPYCENKTPSWYFTAGTGYTSKDPVINFTVSGTYYLRLRTINSCGIEREITKTIEVKKPPIISLDPISDFCNSATIHPVGKVIENCAPSSELTYSWSFPGGTPSSSTSFDPGSINYSVSGNYTATFSVTNSCGTVSKTENFSVNTVLSPIISAKSAEICSGSSFTITPRSGGGDNVPSGTTYIWSTPVVSPSGAVSGAFAQSNQTTSISQSLTNNTANPATVTYTVSPTAGSCPGPDFKVTVKVNPLINASPVIRNSSCFDANDGAINLTVSGGIPFPTGSPYQFSWTGPNQFTSTAEDISNLAPGNYNLRITDNGSCPFSATYTVNQPAKFSFSGVKNDISCNNLNDGQINLNVSGGTAPYTYVWTKDGNPFSTSEDIRNLAAGVYHVKITETRNCGILEETYTIINPPVLVVTLASQKNILCYGYSTGEIDVNVTGGRAVETSPGVFNYTYLWTGPNSFTSTSKNLRNVPAGTYNLRVTDNSGCRDNLTVVLTQNSEIKLQYTKTEIACYNDANASITITDITGGVPFASGDPYIIKWSNLGTGRVQNNLSAGTYIISIEDALGCPKQFPITIDNVPVFSINPDVKQISCFGGNDGHIRLNLVGGVAPIKLVWSDNSTAGTERNNLGPGRYSVTITDKKLCTIQQTFIIKEPLAIELRADVSNPLSCLNANTGAINLIVTGGTPPFTYAWSNGAKTEDLINLPPDNYIVNVTDANGCKATNSWKIIRFEQLTPSVETITDYDCDTKYVKQTFVGHVKGGIPPYKLSWSDGVVSGSNNQIMNTNNNGLIVFSVEDSFGCKQDLPFKVNTPVLGNPNFSYASYGHDVYNLYSIFDPILFTNLATGDFTNISWDFGDGNFSDEENPSHIYTRVGTYTIKQTVTYPFGCQYVYTTTITIEKGYSVTMPTAFSPNNDRINDSFAPVFLGFVEVTLHVYDTWGSLIYSETGENIKGWNGKVKDLDAENGNYYFKLFAKTFYNHTITQEGAFTLIK
ncbi:PKD domain-containing protein [Flavobacterium sufflavum]|uniref:PKD domain-containing protein n=1 Tax=Flavobacterium sufflavum TaxID=1921138 RepID=A0A3S3SUA3_9FLAO|nr:PKD domain-containing protein [Flavobacterium sufflavum]RVT74959.1 PKD domain-containing protein [Flavobacterium sufflavum]